MSGAGLKPKINVHVHDLPADWDVETALSMMDGLNIHTAMPSVASPRVHLGDDAAARALARSVNEQVAAHPGRFGLFAAPPLHDAAGEAAHASHRLAAVGDAILAQQRKGMR